MSGRRTLICVVALAVSACTRTVPETHYYQLVRAPARTIEPAERDAAAGVLAIEELAVDEAYDDDRMIYRSSPVRFDFYHYHRWSSRPGEQVSDYLWLAYARSGLFCAVVRDDAPATALALGGRVIAFEEVDVAPDRWLGRVELELRLHDPASGEIVWQRHVVEEEPIADRRPEGVARALSAAMARIARATGPEIAAIAATRASSPGCSRALRANR